MISYRQNWGENRVYYYDDNEELCSIPANLTDVGPQDPFVAFSRERSYFRVEDMISLAKIVEVLQKGEDIGVIHVKFSQK